MNILIVSIIYYFSPESFVVLSAVPYSGTVNCLGGHFSFRVFIFADGKAVGGYADL